LIGSICEDPISELVVRLFGRVAELDSRPITAEALVGLLSRRMTGRVNRVNAGHLAKSQGIEVRESRTDNARDFVSLVEVCAVSGDKSTTVAGTLLGERHARLVRIDDYDVEAVPEGHFLFTRHHDRPGVVGALGGILGRENINISRMHVGVGDSSENAIALISTSAPLSASALAEIRALPPIEQAVEFEL
jgi:D-3-phosphoglycerate dehydrogenase